jgi:hypothetical protein
VYLIVVDLKLVESKVASGARLAERFVRLEQVYFEVMPLCRQSMASDTYVND